MEDNRLYRCRSLQLTARSSGQGWLKSHFRISAASIRRRWAQRQIKNQRPEITLYSSL